MSLGTVISGTTGRLRAMVGSLTTSTLQGEHDMRYDIGQCYITHSTRKDRTTLDGRPVAPSWNSVGSTRPDNTRTRNVNGAACTYDSSLELQFSTSKRSEITSPDDNSTQHWPQRLSSCSNHFPNVIVATLFYCDTLPTYYFIVDRTLLILLVHTYRS